MASETFSRTGFPLATYTVHSAGGATIVPINQTQNGGQWNLLGTFTLNPALAQKVELFDQPNGRVVADAVMVVASGVSTDHVTYTPTLTTSGTVDIYAKWTESATRAQGETHIVQHAGGPKSQPGFSWLNRKHLPHRVFSPFYFPATAGSEPWSLMVLCERGADKLHRGREIMWKPISPVRCR